MKHTLLTAEVCRIHGLAQDLDGQTASLSQRALVVVVLLEQTLGTGVVGADAGGLPAAVVATGVALVELELTLVVVSGVDERDTKGTETTVLSVTLLEIAQATDELLAGDLLVVGQEVVLGGGAGVVDENVGVGRHSSDGADHVARNSSVQKGNSATCMGRRTRSVCTASRRMCLVRAVCW